MMNQHGYILILCLCFIALVSVMTLSSLTISQLSIRISQSSQQQLQAALTARLRHWQQLASRQLVLQHRVALPDCPAQYAVWLTPQARCEQVRATTAAAPELATLAWSSLIVRQHLQLPLHRGQ